MRGRLGVCPAVGLDESRRIGVRARRRVVDVLGGRGGVLVHGDQVEMSLLGVGPDEQVGIGAQAGGDGCGGLGVEDQAEGAEPDQRVVVGPGLQVAAHEPGGDPDQAVVGDLREGVNVGFGAQGLGRRPGDAGGLLDGERAQTSAASDDRPVEEARGFGGGEDAADDGRPGRLAAVGGHVDAAELALGLRRGGPRHGGVLYAVPRLARQPVGTAGTGRRGGCPGRRWCRPGVGRGRFPAPWSRRGRGDTHRACSWRFREGGCVAVSFRRLEVACQGLA